MKRACCVQKVERKEKQERMPKEYRKQPTNRYPEWNTTRERRHPEWNATRDRRHIYIPISQLSEEGMW